MHALTAHEITVILLAMGVMLALARILGEVFRRFNQPAVIGELLAGLLLGPTVLGRLWPDMQQAVFPTGGRPELVIQGITTVAVVLFLLVAGMEVDLMRLFRQGRAAAAVSLSGILVPFAAGLATAWALPDFLGRGAGVQPYVFALFFATAMSISALPVIAKTLMDLNLYRSDLGMVVIAAAIFDDLAGWFIFAIVLGMMQQDPGRMLITGTIGLTILYVAFMLTVGRWFLHWILPWIQAKTSWPGGVLAFSLALALFGAAFTQSIGVHAVFGSFLVGVALGDSVHLRERTRLTIEQFVSSIFAPLFFANVGLHLDFLAFFDWKLVLLVLAVAMASKVIGCGLGARHAGIAWRESWAIGFGMNSRGAMGIILGTLAFDNGLIDQRMLVALVTMAIVTSMISGSAMQWILQRRAPRRFLDYLHPRGFINPLQSIDREGAIRELAHAASAISGLNADAIEGAVLQRERMMPTGLGLCVAVPHARLKGMSKPLVCLGVSRSGIEFAAPDGERSQMIFLILTPAEDDGAQLEILADISRTFLDANLRHRSMLVNSFTEFIAMLRTRETARGRPR